MNAASTRRAGVGRLGALAAALGLGACLWLAPPAGAQEEGEYIGLMNDYLTLAESVVQVTGRPEGAVFLALEGIFEVYEQRRDAPGAVRHLERLLAEYGQDRALRNLIRFKLRDIYKETGQGDKALEQLDLVIAENARGTGGGGEP